MFNNENIIELLETLGNSITQNLRANSLKEKVTIKYEWLAKEFNFFIDQYINELVFLESNFIPEEDEIQKIISLKIASTKGL